MIIEIEHKYSVHRQIWETIQPERSVKVNQAYLHSDISKTIRVRVMGNRGYITIKGKTNSASRPEYEYEIPVEEARELIANFAYNVIEKTRHYVTYAGNVWEVDEFYGANEGMLIAEIELKSEDQHYEIPEWIHENITSDRRYSNAYLAEHPYKTWVK